MNCPHHMMIYANRPHSYRDLPMRIGEIAHDFRYESSGTLKGIERGRHFCQNDAHLFCTCLLYTSLCGGRSRGHGRLLAAPGKPGQPSLRHEKRGFSLSASMFWTG